MYFIYIYMSNSFFFKIESLFAWQNIFMNQDIGLVNGIQDVSYAQYSITVPYLAAEHL